MARRCSIVVVTVPQGAEPGSLLFVETSDEKGLAYEGVPPFMEVEVPPEAAEGSQLHVHLEPESPEKNPAPLTVVTTEEQDGSVFVQFAP